MKNFNFYLFANFLFLTSCQIYRNQFDCPPCKGVPCTSVTKLEKMIVETDEGADVFVGQKLLGSQKGNCVQTKTGKIELLGKKIWIADIDCEGQPKNNYIYLSE